MRPRGLPQRCPLCALLLSAVLLVRTSPAASTPITFGGPDAGLEVSAVSGELNAPGTTAAFTVSLLSEPSGDVTVRPVSGNTDEVEVGSDLIFTDADWNISQTVLLTSGSAFKYEFTDTAEVSTVVSLATSSWVDRPYTCLAVGDVIVTNNHSAAENITLNASELDISQASQTFSIGLQGTPVSPVTIDMTSTNSHVQVSPSRVELSADVNGVVADVTLTVSSFIDDYADGNISAVLSTASSVSTDAAFNALDGADVRVMFRDPVVAGVKVTMPPTFLDNTTTPESVTVTLDSKPRAPVTITAASGDAAQLHVEATPMIFTPSTWNISQSVNLSAIQEFENDGDAAVVVTLTAVSDDADYVLSSLTTVTVVDTDGPATIAMTPDTSCSAGCALGEDAPTTTISYELSTRPTAPVTVSFAVTDVAHSDRLNCTPSALTFTSEGSSQNVTFDASNDVQDGDITVTVTITVTSGDTTYAGLTMAPLVYVITDDDVASISATAADTSLAESGVAVEYTSNIPVTDTAAVNVSLGSKPTADVIIAVSSTDVTEGTVAPATITFTPEDYMDPVVVVVSAADDNDAVLTEMFQVQLVASSADPVYHQMSTSVPFTNVDSLCSFISVTSDAVEPIGEADTYTLTVARVAATGPDLVITAISVDGAQGNVAPSMLTLSDQIGQAVTVSLVADSLEEGTVYAQWVTFADADGRMCAVPTNVTDAQTGEVTFATAASQFGEDASLGVTKAPAVIALSVAPRTQCEVTITANPAGQVELSMDRLTFTDTASEMITISAVDDDLLDGTVQVTLTMTGTGDYADITKTATLTVYDDEAPINVGDVAGAVGENRARASITVSLSQEPTAAVTIFTQSNNTKEVTPEAATLVFTKAAWTQVGTIWLVGQDDDVADGDQPVLISFVVGSSDAAYSGRSLPNRQVLNVDNDAPTLVADFPANMTLLESGSSLNYTVRLASEPLAPVTVSITNSTPFEVLVSPEQLIFSANPVGMGELLWSDPATVQITGVDDEVVDGDADVVITTSVTSSADASYTGLSVSTSVVNLDDDTEGFEVSPGGPYELGECGSTILHAAVLSVPIDSALVTIICNDTTQATVSPSVLTFGATHSRNQTVTIHAVDDAIDDETTHFSITFDFSTSTDETYLELDDVVINFIGYNDADTAGITISPSTVTFDERPSSANVSVVLTSQPLNDVLIVFRSDDASEGTVYGGNVTFTPGTWNVAQTMTISSVNDWEGDVDVNFAVTGTVISEDVKYADLEPYVDVTNNHRHTDYLFAVEPANFVEGQELRVRLTTIYIGDNGTVEEVAYIAADDDTALELRTYTYSDAHGTDCEAYAASSASPPFTTSRFALDGSASRVSTVYATFLAGSADEDFVVCVKHNMPREAYFVHSLMNNKWIPVSVNGTSVWSSSPAELWYRLPEPSVGQYAIIELLANETWEFEYAPSSCATDLDRCRGADNLKLVPAGQPCTFEYWAFGADYYGTDAIDSGGVWHSSSTAGLVEGSTAGGVGVFGTQYANPLVDTWTQGGEYNTMNNETVFADNTHTPGQGYQYSPGHRAYVYLRMPGDVASFDVCFSSVQQRRSLANETRPFAVPIWRKAFPCAEAEYTTDATCGASAPTSGSFSTVAEVVGWATVDTTPLSWGTIVIDDSGEAQLSTRSAGAPPSGSSGGSTAGPQPASVGNYWAPTGGDYFRIVPADLFSETAAAARSGVHAAVAAGSTASVGCWHTGMQVSASHMGGWAEAGAEYPIGSYDLTGDPTSRVRDNDTTGVAATFSALFMPPLGTSWHVCYRRTCAFADAACAAHSGMRVIPVHSSARGATPKRWQHLEETYTHEFVLVPEAVNATLAPPPVVTWYANDTRTSTFGPLVIEQQPNTTSGLDARPWNLVRQYVLEDNVLATQGGSMRLVLAGMPCDYSAFETDVAAGRGAVSVDGGMLECNSVDVVDDASLCSGEVSDVQETAHVAHYFDVPVVDAGGYRVCFRHGGWNWRGIAATPTAGAWLSNDSAMPSVVLERAGWSPPVDDLYRPTAASTVVATIDNAYSQAEALILIEDTASKLTLAPRSRCPGGCSASGDVVRFVRRTESCSLNPTSFRAINTDSFPHRYCPTPVVGDAPCGSPGYDGAALALFNATTPPVYDDVIPALEVATGQAHAATDLVLPAFAANDVNEYKVCYKQAAMANWMQFDAVLTEGVVAGITPAARSAALIGGSMEKFALDLVDAIPINHTLTSFYAKFAPYTAADPYTGCLVPPQRKFDTTRSFAITDATRRKVEFMLVVPQEAGEYSLCVHAVTHDGRGTHSWWRAGAAQGQASFNVVDNGVRWFVAPEWTPTNNGVTKVGFVRCVPGADGACDSASSTDVFDTDPHMDAAKLVDVGTACGDGTGEAFNFGASDHVGVEVAIHGFPAVGGVTNLGPADGLSDLAELTTTLPPMPDDVGATYRVCIRTAMTQRGVRAPGAPVWVEALQANHIPTQAYLTLTDGTSAFHTAPGILRSWSIAPGLVPSRTLYTGAPVEDTALAGASTLVVANPLSTQPPAPGYGFTLNTYAPLPSQIAANATFDFKLVAARRPFGRLPVDQRDPEGWGDVGTWTWDGPVADCLGQGWETTSTLACDSTAGGDDCPRVVQPLPGATSISSVFHVPLDPGEYYVCFRITRGGVRSPWLQLPSHSTGGYCAFSHPTFLEVASAGDNTNVAVIDSLTVNPEGGDGVPVDAATWCRGPGSEVDCSQQALTADLFTVVNGSQVCPTPGGAVGAPDWYELTPATDITVVVDTTSVGSVDNSFRLPPRHFTSPSGMYKLCVYKAGTLTDDSNFTADAISKPGVVYQLYNRGGADTGGPGALWQDVNGLYATRLTVEASLDFDNGVRFMEYAPDLESRYGAASIAVENVTDPATGKISNTPLLRSGTTVTYQVSVATADGVRIPTRSYHVDVIRCRKAAFWNELECLQNSQEGIDSEPGPFALVNVGGACDGADALRYGWHEDGLRQFSIGGVVSFSLQYVSACPPGVFGCGVRFKASSSGSATLWSPAQWVNVAEHVPDSVSIDGGLQTPDVMTTPLAASECSANAVDCFKKRCVSGLECALSFQARYLGPIEHAPRETLSLHYSAGDYAGGVVSSIPVPVFDAFGDTVGSPPLILDAKWHMGGGYGYKFVPQLLHGADVAHVFLNVSYGAPEGPHWTRFVVEVVRDTPTSLELDDVTPLDVTLGLTAGGKRMPVPAPGVDSVAPQSLRVAERSYLEALVPYALSFTPQSAHAGPPQELPVGIGALTGYNITARVLGSQKNMVLSPAAKPEDNFATPAEVLGRPLSMPVTDEDTDFVVPFRIYVADSQCSRFSPTRGCTMEFQFSKPGHPVLVGDVFAAVRVPAATLRVVVADTAATVREGIAVEVYPGTYIRQRDNNVVFVGDDFHHAEAFALLAGPAPTNGMTNRDGLTIVPDFPTASGAATCADPACALVKYQLGDVSGMSSGLGAAWTIRPSLPCYECEMTFHTTWGAGPQSYDTTPYATATLTFRQDDVVLSCPTREPIPFVVGTGGTEAFDLEVMAGVRGRPGVSAVYPRWWVYLDTNQSASEPDLVHTAGLYGDGYALTRGGVRSGLLTAQMGAGAVAMFEGLKFEGEDAPVDRAPEGFRLTFHTAGYLYESLERGSSQATGTKAMTCVASLEVYRFETLPPTPAPTTYGVEIRIHEVAGARSLCDEAAANCTDWRGTIEDVADAGLSFTVEFLNVSSDGEVSVDTGVTRNVTIVPLGGPHSVPQGVHPTWRYESAGEVFRSTEVHLDSEYNINPLEQFGGDTYTYGTPRMVATRPLTRAAQRAVVNEDGRGMLTLRYADPRDAAPVRNAVFALCESVWDGWEEVVTGRCVRVNLWLAPRATEALTAVTSQPPEHPPLVLGNGSACGATLATLTVVSYFTVPTANATLRFYEYSTAIDYEVAAAGQLFTVPGSKVQQLSLAKSNVVPAGAGNTHNITDGLKVSFEFYGSRLIDVPTRVEITATSRDADAANVVVRGVLTEGRYKWLLPNESIATWSLANRVTLDDECPTKRYLMATRHNYRAYAADGVPAQGWDYSGHTAAVGLPFPIQTMVTTAEGTRARSFPSSFVKVMKRSASGCNDGGRLDVYRLASSTADDTRVRVFGALADGWLPAHGGMRTHEGVAVPWVVFSAECESCTLQMQLCYAGETAETCMDDLFAADSTLDLPLYPDRSKVSKPFRVQRPMADTLQVVDQTLPNATSHETLDTGAVQTSVGDLFEIQFEAVQHFGEWAMMLPSTAERPQIHVVIHSRAVIDTSEAHAQRRYGNSGFMAEGAARWADGQRAAEAAGVCGVPLARAEFAGAVVDLPLQLDAEQRGRFYFARPCTHCEVAVGYGLLRPGIHSEADAHFGAFVLRHYTESQPGAAAVFVVHTCGTAWMLAGVPPVAVRRRRHFSLTAVEVDANGVLATVPSGESVAFRAVAGHGNGGGGDVTVSSPTTTGKATVDVHDVISQNGSATVRAAYSRSCYACYVSFAGCEHALTVLTDPTQIIAIPVDARDYMPRVMTRADQAAAWHFEVYLADELSHRAYTVGGPTPSAFIPRYAHPHAAGRAAAQLEVGTAVEARVKAVGPRGSTVEVTTGEMAVSVADGGDVYNGIPVPSGNATRVGTVTVEAVSPGIGSPVHFNVEGYEDLPTSHSGMPKPPTLTYSVPAAQIVAQDLTTLREDGQCTTTGMLAEKGPCRFSVAAVGRAPGASDGVVHYSSWTSPNADEVARASVVCPACGSATVDAVARFYHGEATFSLTAETSKDVDCTCTVTVQPPPALVTQNATNVTFSVTYTRTAVSHWVYGTSDAVVVSGDLVGGVYEAETVANRTVGLAVYATDADRMRVMVWDLRWRVNSSIDVTASAMSPQGCFVCEAPCRADTSDSTSRVVIRGHFPMAGRCVLTPSALSGFPTQTTADVVSPLRGLAVDVASPAAARAKVVEPLTGAVFYGLWASTLSGQPAAIVGWSAYLTIDVLDASGAIVEGDNTMILAMTATAGAYSKSWNQTAKAGVATFKLDSEEPTRTADCEANYTLGMKTECEHEPYYYTVNAYAEMADGSVEDYGTIEVGPLHFVRRVVSLDVYAPFGKKCDDVACLALTAGGDPGRERMLQLWKDGWVSLSHGNRESQAGLPPYGRERVHPASWLFGAPFDMVVVAWDITLYPVHHPEDMPPARVEFVPIHTPCAVLDDAAHRAWIESTCIDGGACVHSTFDDLPLCTSEASGWAAPAHFALEGGFATLKDISFGAVAGRPGLRHFRLRTSDLKTDGEASQFLFEANMQQVAHLRLKSEYVTCEGAVCQAPPTKDFIETMMSKKFPSRVGFDVHLVDVLGDVVIADSVSHVAVTGTCESDPASHLAYDNKGVLEYLTAPVFPVDRAGATVTNLTVSSDCERMRLVLTCSSSSPFGCNGLSTVLYLSHWQAPGKESSVPAPATARELVASCLSLGPVVEGISLEDYAATFDVRGVEAALFRFFGERELTWIEDVDLEFICERNVAECSGIPDASSVDCVQMGSSNVTDGVDFGTPLLRGALPLQAKHLYLSFNLALVIDVDAAIASSLIATAIATDLALPPDESLLRSASAAMRNAEASALIVNAQPAGPDATPIPSTPQPLVPTAYPTTPLPETAAPTQPPSVAPVTALPPPAFTRTPVVPFEGGWALRPGLTSVVLAATTALLLLL